MPRQTTKTDAGFKPIWYRLHEKGNTFTALVLSKPEKREVTDQKGNVQTWDNGDAKIEYVYDLLDVSYSDHSDSCHWCGQRTSEDNYEGDTGARKFAAKPAQHKMIQQAIADAKNADGQNELYGPVTVTLTGKKKPEKPGGFASNTYEVTYRIPTDEEVDRVDEFLGVDDTPQAPVSAVDSEVSKPNMSEAGLEDLMKLVQ